MKNSLFSIIITRVAVSKVVLMKIKEIGWLMDI